MRRILKFIAGRNGNPAFNFVIGTAIATTLSGTFTRATSAEYVNRVDSQAFQYKAGDSTASATFTRATTAEYVASV